MTLRLPSAGSFRVATDREDYASFSLVEGPDHGRPRELPTGPGTGTAVGISRATDVRLTLPAAATTLCGLEPGSVAPR